MRNAHGVGRARDEQPECRSVFGIRAVEKKTYSMGGRGAQFSFTTSLETEGSALRKVISVAYEIA